MTDSSVAAPAPTSAGEAPAPATPAPSTPAPATPAASTPAAAVDWKSLGIDDGGLAMIQERQWKGVPDLMKSYRELEKLMSAPPERLIKVPKSNDAGEWGLVYDKMGRPKDAAGYNLPVPDGNSGELAKDVAKWMYEAGLSEAQGRGLAVKWNAHVAALEKASQEQMTADHTQQVAALKSEWGPNYQANTEVVDRAAQSFGMTLDQLGALKVALGPKGAMTFLYNIGAKIAVEDKTLIRNPDGSPSFKGMTPEIARSEISRLQGDKAFAGQFNSQDPKTRAEARERMKNLQTVAYPAD